ncbi:Protein lifeguard 1 [Bagarius yarrelli]|uniref:Protein lifeguard 1 n=1 Tax=Bagarius yarrelli TaxID=175774 RepID=A0A556VUF7_BAGYA|nr:Protein lifeguard 1 [Bagarius yarrelli]
MEKPAVVNGDQSPPAYNPTYPQPPTYAEEAGISTITQSGYNIGTEDGMPPEYIQSFEDVNCFSEANVRRGFIRKVYLTLMVQLLITVGIICTFLYWETLKLWVLRTSWFAYTMIFFNAEAVLWAVGATALVSFGLSLFAMQSKYLVIDTQLMLGGKYKYTISAEEYIFTALNLYLDIVTLFLMILQLFSRCQ